MCSAYYKSCLPIVIVLSSSSSMLILKPTSQRLTDLIVELETLTSQMPSLPVKFAIDLTMTTA